MPRKKTESYTRTATDIATIGATNLVGLSITSQIGQTLPASPTTTKVLGNVGQGFSLGSTMAQLRGMQGVMEGLKGMSPPPKKRTKTIY